MDDDVTDDDDDDGSKDCDYGEGDDDGSDCDDDGSDCVMMMALIVIQIGASLIVCSPRLS